MATYSTETVLFVQQSLNKLGNNLVEDGLYGANTKNAIIAYQKSKSVLPTGIIDSDLIKLLKDNTAVSTSTFSLSNVWVEHGKKIAIGGSVVAVLYGVWFINNLRGKKT